MPLSPDHLRSSITRSTGEAMKGVLSSSHPDLEAPLSRFLTMFQEDVFEVNVGSLTHNIPAATDFHFHVGKLDGKGFVLKPTIAIDQDQVTMGNPADLLSEMARIIFIASQYPNSGFEESMESVYGEAFRLQSVFLEDRQSSEVINDPRYNDNQELFRKLYPGPRYFYDPSYLEYQRKLDKFALDEPENLDAIQKASTREAFVIARELVFYKTIDSLDNTIFDESDRKNCRDTAAIIIASEAIQLTSDNLLYIDEN